MKSSDQSQFSFNPGEFWDQKLLFHTEKGRNLAEKWLKDRNIPFSSTRNDILKGWVIVPNASSDVVEACRLWFNMRPINGSKPARLANNFLRGSKVS